LRVRGRRDPSEAVAARGQRYRRQSGNMGDSYFPNIRGHAKPGSRTTAAAAAPLLSRPQPRLDRGVMRAIVRHANSRFAGLRSPGRCRAGSPSMIDSGDVPVTRHALQRSRGSRRGGRKPIAIRRGECAPHLPTAIFRA